MQKKKKNKVNTGKKINYKYIAKLLIITIFVTLLLEFFYVIIKSTYDYMNKELLEFNKEIVNTDQGYIIAGSSNFKYSKFNRKSGEKEKPRIAIYKNNKIVQEIKYKGGINGLFNSVIVDGNYYVAVGHYEKDNHEHNNYETEGLIVKYNKNKKIVFEDSYSDLSKSRFVKVLNTKDGYIVVGNSVYNNLESGDAKAGALIIKYDKKGKIKWKKYNGSSHYGIYNDIIEVSDGYIVVGSIDDFVGAIVKYDKNGNKKWQKEYNNVDQNGLNNIILVNNKLYLTGTLNKSNKAKNRTTTAVLIKADLSGKMEKYIEYGDDASISEWNDMIIYNNKVYLVGQEAYINKKLTKDTTTYYNNKAIYAVYDLNLRLIDKEEVDKKDRTIYIYTSLIEKDKKLYITGYTNAKIKEMTYADGKNNVSFINSLPLK